MQNPTAAEKKYSLLSNANKYNVVRIYNSLCTHGNCVFSYSAHKEVCTTVCADVGGESTYLQVKFTYTYNPSCLQNLLSTKSCKITTKYTAKILLNKQHIILTERMDFKNYVTV